MNGKIAKKLRKFVYKDKDPRDRKYGRLKKTGMVITIEYDKKISDRIVYQRLKKAYNETVRNSRRGVFR